MKKALLVEDDKFLLKVYKNQLAKEGVDATILDSGVGAVEVAENEEPAVIVLDLIMPRKDGFEVFKELKANPKTKDIPVIIVTVLGKEEERKFESEEQPDEYLVKTELNISDVISAIKKYL